MAGRTSKKPTTVTKKAAAKRVAAKPTLLAGGNPQIAKGDGDAPVQAYIAAMPGWKRDVGRRLDALIERSVPDVRKLSFTDPPDANPPRPSSDPGPARSSLLTIGENLYEDPLKEG